MDINIPATSSKSIQRNKEISKMIIQKAYRL